MQDRNHPSFWTTLVLILAAMLAFSAPATAQKMGTKDREFPAHGFEFKPLHAMLDAPVNDNLQRFGAIGQFKAEKSVPVKLEDGYRGMYDPTLMVVRLDPAAPESGEQPKKDEEEEEEEESGKENGYVSIETVVSIVSPGIQDAEWEDVEVENVRISKDLDATRYILEGRQRMSTGSFMGLVVDTYEFPLGDYKIVMVWEYPAEKKYRSRWEKAIKKSMKSFDLLRGGAEEIDIDEVNSESSYEDLLAYHTHDVEQTPGWRLVETPTKQYLIKTNVEKKNRKDIDRVIERIEASRELYEKDFPPSREITSVSVVRVCATRDDFNLYGQTGGGVAGYFNPGSEELVLFFDNMMSEEATLSVMAHEGFHQYCHFLFNRSEAHRWFDEGHGDYYGAWKMRGGRLVPEEDMDGGLARIPEIKSMHKMDKITPLSEHIRFSHPEWQSQGPSNVSCYAQSFALIRFLRDGANGDVSRKYWKDEYSEILPAYIESLSTGYNDAYAAIQAEAKEQLDAIAKTPGISQQQKDVWQRRFDNPWDFLDRTEKAEIMDQAMTDSWGLIDEEEFEDRWLEYVDRVL